MSRQEFRQALEDYKEHRAPGDKEHKRQSDVNSGSISPQKLYGTPVGLMFFEGAPRILTSGASIPHLQDGDPKRIIVEAYPGVLARSLIQRRSYKNDTKAKQTEDQHKARQEILRKITSGALKDSHNLNIVAPKELADDPGADHLDALLCAIQAAWAWNNRKSGYGAPKDLDPLEGWIADPSC